MRHSFGAGDFPRGATTLFFFALLFELCAFARILLVFFRVFRVFRGSLAVELFLQISPPVLFSQVFFQHLSHQFVGPLVIKVIG